LKQPEGCIEANQTILLGEHIELCHELVLREINGRRRTPPRRYISATTDGPAEGRLSRLSIGRTSFREPRG
jgi:hypothetical protein